MRMYIYHMVRTLMKKLNMHLKNMTEKLELKDIICSLKETAYLINKFLNKLKEQNKFDNSLIILNADTGSLEID